MGEQEVRKGDWIVRHAPAHRAYLSLVTGVTTTFHSDGRSPYNKLTLEFIDGFASPSEAVEAAFKNHGAARVFLLEDGEYHLQERTNMAERKPVKGELKRKYVSANNAHNRMVDVLNIVRAFPYMTGQQLVMQGLLKKKDSAFLYLLEQEGAIEFIDHTPGDNGGWVVKND